MENLNRQWRWWFPLGTELAGISPAEANAGSGHHHWSTPPEPNYQSPATLYAALTVR